MKTTHAPLVSDGQLALFWKLYRRAWSAQCARTGTPPNLKGASDSWRHVILQAEAGNPSIKHLHRDKFDQVMLRLAIEAGDTRDISYWSDAVERRLRYLIEETLREMASLDSTRDYSWHYAISCYHKAKLPLKIHDAPAEMLHKVYQMLDTHRRRLQHRPQQLEEAPF